MCPSSRELADFQNGKADSRIQEISAHLSACEFCRAEVEFYAHYPVSDEKPPAPDKIPESLLELARALLGSGQEKISLLKSLLIENRNSDHRRR